MLNKSLSKATICKLFSFMLLIGGTGFFTPKPAFALTGDEVMNKLSAAERVSYLTGVMEGIAQVWYVTDKPDRTGFDCIYDWYYKDTEQRSKLVRTWLTRHADNSASALLYVLIKKECGES